MWAGDSIWKWFNPDQIGVPKLPIKNGVKLSGLAVPLLPADQKEKNENVNKIS
jgi:hypothetical protein